MPSRQFCNHCLSQQITNYNPPHTVTEKLSTCSQGVTLVQGFSTTNHLLLDLLFQIRDVMIVHIHVKFGGDRTIIRGEIDLQL